MPTLYGRVAHVAWMSAGSVVARCSGLRCPPAQRPVPGQARSGLAALEGRTWVRIDTWRTNTGLHAYYERLGFRHVRTEAPSHRRSGWLAQRRAGELALPDDLLPVGPYGGCHGYTATPLEVPHQRAEAGANDDMTSGNGTAP